MPQDDNQTKKRKKLKFTLLILGVSVSLYVAHQVVKHKGYCIPEMRILTSQQIMDRALFGKRGDTMTFEEKKAEVPNYPECCRVKGGAKSLKNSENFLSERKIYYFTNMAIEEWKGETEYVELSDGLDSCGNKAMQRYFSDIPVWSARMGYGEDDYLRIINQNREYWQKEGDEGWNE
ncbi:MAG: hypothetical protein ACQEQL_06620 [Pseudomonadota bacterium]